MPLSPTEYDQWKAIQYFLEDASDEWGPDLAEDDTQAVFADGAEAATTLIDDSTEIRLGNDRLEEMFASRYETAVEKVSVALQRAHDLNLGDGIPALTPR